MICARKLGFSIALVVLAATSRAYGEPIVTSFTSPSVSGSQDNSLGYRFTANSNSSIVALGFYDLGQNGLPSSSQVGLFSSSGVLLGSVTVPSGTGGTLIGDFRYINLGSPITLSAGSDYYIAGTTLGTDWVFQASSIVTDPAITYLGSYFVSGTGGNVAFPVNFASDREYITVNALTAAVPEPASMLAWGLIAGAGAVGYRLRKRKVAAVA